MKKILICTSVFFVLGCAHKGVEKQIDEKLSQENSALTKKELSQEASQSISQYPGLTADQKSKLTMLQSTVQAKMEQTRIESLKLRSLLIKEITAQTYDESAVKSVKNRIKKLEESKVKTLFTAVDDANKILGRENKVEKEHVMNEFFERRSMSE